MKPIVFFFSCLFLLSACRDNDPIVPDEDVQSGGATTIDGAFVTIFQQPASNLLGDEIEEHRLADLAFGDVFVTAPNPINAGLGPLFNQNSCESCHLGNGRSPFPTSADNLRGLLIRLSIPGTGPNGEPMPVPGFGGQLQNKAAFGIQPEARITITETEEIVNYLDGYNASLRTPHFSFADAYMPMPAEMLYSPRIAPPVIGLGLLEAIAENDILALADPADANGDGISGKPNYGWDATLQTRRLGRFGWKAAQPSLLQQSAAAYSGDMGITTPLFPSENCTGQPQHDGLPDEPEVNEATLLAATFYTQSLAVPARRNWDDPEVQRGKQLFTTINCTGCHNPGFVTGQHYKFSFLSQQKIFPYTDLLLHDMGEGLADNRPDFDADGREWRTPPLWGIGLTQTVGGHSNFLHDGRARSLEEAVLWHGGEAEKSKEDFKKLSKNDREAVIRFLESL